MRDWWQWRTGYKAIGQDATFPELVMTELTPDPKRVAKLLCLFAAILDHKDAVEKSLIFSRVSLLHSSLFWDSVSNISLSSSAFLEMFASSPSWNYFPLVLWIFLLQNLPDPGSDLSAVLLATGWKLIVMQKMKLGCCVLSMRMSFLHFLRKKQDHSTNMHLKMRKINGRKYVRVIFSPQDLTLKDKLFQLYRHICV